MKSVVTSIAAALLAAVSTAIAADAKVDLKRAEQIVSGRCFLCRGAEGESASPIFPRLAGQHAAYLEGQFKDFNKRERTNDNAVMHAIASRLTELEIKAVSVYISGMK